MKQAPDYSTGISAHNPGFTLVELLVSVAIIALLASVLIPAVGRARSSAELTKCRVRLKNLGLALTLYAQDHRGDFPVTECLHNPQLQLLQDTAQYVQQKQSFYCPSNTNDDEKYTPENFTIGNIGYFYFSCQKRPRSLDTSMFLRRVVSWPRKLDVNFPPGTWLASDIWYSGAPTAHLWYKRGVNYLCTDSSVDFVPESMRSAFK